MSKPFDKYFERLKTFDQKVLDKKVYRLCGEDVISILEEKGLLEKLTNEQVEEIINYVERKLEIPWSEYVDVTLDVMAINNLI